MHQCLLQAVARLAVAAFAPQQAGEALAGMRVPGRHGEVGEKRALLLPRQIDDRAGCQPGLESAEQCQLHVSHRRNFHVQTHDRRRSDYCIPAARRAAYRWSKSA
jgi:hypothetical protein